MNLTKNIEELLKESGIDYLKAVAITEQINGLMEEKKNYKGLLNDNQDTLVLIVKNGEPVDHNGNVWALEDITEASKYINVLTINNEGAPDE